MRRLLENRGFQPYRWDVPRWDVEPPAFSYDSRDGGVVADARVRIVTCAKTDDPSAPVRDLVRARYGLANALAPTANLRVGLPGEPDGSILVFAYAVMLDDEMTAATTTFGFIVRGWDSAKEILQIETTLPEGILRRGPGDYWAHRVKDGWVLRRGESEVRRLPKREPAFCRPDARARKTSGASNPHKRYVPDPHVRNRRLRKSCAGR